jgi:hypothetical protein
MNWTPTQEQMDYAAAVLRASGVPIPLPWEGDLDDREREVFDAFQEAISVVVRMDREAR